MSNGVAPLPSAKVVPVVWSRYTDIVVDHGEGSWLMSVDGTRYLDYSAGIGVASTGHAHPRVVSAVVAQASKLLHGQQNIVYHEPGLRLHDRLSRLLPGEGWGAFLSNSGAEAIEAAIKLARIATGRPAIVAFRGGFHGRTAQAMALTAAKTAYRGDFEPLPGSIYHTSFPYCYRSVAGSHNPAACICPWEADLELLFAQLVDPCKVAAIVVEPVIGEGGYVVPPEDFLPRLRQISRRYGILLIADEIQTGFGRTGRLFAIEHADVIPDIVVVAKGIASGLPLSGIIAQRTLLDAFPPGAHGGTYGGNVVSCAAALATLDVIEEEGLVENARERGAVFLEGLRELAADRPAIGDVRGLGLMLALEFVAADTGDRHQPNPAMAAKVLSESLARGLIVLSAGTWGQVVRIVPPLVTTADEVSHALSILDSALDAALATSPS